MAAVFADKNSKCSDISNAVRKYWHINMLSECALHLS